MPIQLDDVRRFALALPGTTEEPHHTFGSFRVRGRIFVTIPPGGEWLHIFLPEHERELALAMDPDFLEPVVWGRKVLGVRARLPRARRSTVLDLVRKAYVHKAPAGPHAAARMAEPAPAAAARRSAGAPRVARAPVPPVGRSGRSRQPAGAGALADAANLGPKSAEVLACAGITTLAQLRQLGSVRAFVRARQVGAKVSLNLLWALEGALLGQPWRSVAREHRTRLLLALEDYEREDAGRPPAA